MAQLDLLVATNTGSRTMSNAEVLGEVGLRLDVPVQLRYKLRGGGSWECPVCTFINLTSNPVCEVCGGDPPLVSSFFKTASARLPRSETRLLRFSGSWPMQDLHIHESSRSKDVQNVSSANGGPIHLFDSFCVMSVALFISSLLYCLQVCAKDCVWISFLQEANAVTLLSAAAGVGDSIMLVYSFSFLWLPSIFCLC